MNSPSPLSRLAGMPLIALVLVAGCGAVIFGWYQGNVRWWLALLAFFAALRILQAVREVRTYKTWLANWNAIGKPQEAPPAKKPSAAGRWVFTICALGVFILLPLTRDVEQPVNTLESFIWVGCGLYLLFALVRAIVRRVSKSRKAKADSPPSGKPVEWMLRAASSSPSRADAMQKLPQYCAELLKR